ncbi:MAG: CHRD domain-containing protein [Rhodocyclales bacterium GWA2_65_20]|nr:MAG: CHRD domain-containing protein [Rhodocyclales bacterium GWA2_65_20]
MNTLRLSTTLKFFGTIAAAAISLAAYSTMAFGDEIKVTLSGDKEVPPVKTAATGSGTVMINADMTVGGSVTTTAVAGTMAHIHHGAAGTNGPVIITLSKKGDTWTVPAGAKLTDAQYQAYKAGELYINVHSAENKGGEVRGQIK